MEKINSKKKLNKNPFITLHKEKGLGLDPFEIFNSPLNLLGFGMFQIPKGSQPKPFSYTNMTHT
jgi:hypothetical protein